MIEVARAVGGEQHGFRFIQLPLNLAMPEAVSVLNEAIDGRPMMVLEAAGWLGVTAVASGSMLQGRLAMNAQAAIQFVRSAPGITTALVGMSRVEHVDENLQLVNVNADEQSPV
jgi:predicted aldo/keto reductase-like oxidoreductase